MPVSQEIVTVVSLDAVGQVVCAWTPAMAAVNNPITRTICLMEELITNFSIELNTFRFSIPDCLLFALNLLVFCSVCGIYGQ
jgi:hypothetical protein